MSGKLSAMLAPALAHVARGQYVLFCVPRGKLPLTEPGLQEHGLRDATIDPEIVAKILKTRPDANLALACQACGFVVIDVDRHGDIDGEATLAALKAELGPLPETVEAVTGGGGRHLVFQASPGAEFRGSLGPGLDLKHAGYIVIAPSVHESARAYRWIRSPLDEMPAPLSNAWLARMLKPAAPKATTPPPVARTSSGYTPYGRAAVEDEIERLRTAIETTRNNTLNEVTFRLARLRAGGEIDDCREELFNACATNGLVADDGESKVRATIESGWRAGLREPRTAPAREGKPTSHLGGKTAKTAITATATPNAEEWPDPQPLVVDVAQMPYPVDALPSTFHDAVVEVRDFVQAPVSMVAMSALGAASLAVQGLVNVQRTEGLAGPVGLFLLALAPSGERKSTIDNRFSTPIRKYEIEESEKGEPLLSDYKADLASWTAKKRGLETKIEKASRDGKASDADEERIRKLVSDEPKSPRIPSLLYNDATMEALAYGLAKVWPSACIQSSEAGSVFGAHTMNKEAIMRTLSLYNVLWDGGPIRISRRAVGGSYWVKNARLTMNLQVQPGMFLDFIENDRGLSRDSGFLARTLIACPTTTQGTRRFREPPTSWPAVSKLCNRIAALLNEPLTIDEDGGLKPVVLTLTTEAKTAWVQFHDRIERELGIGGSLCDVRDVASKIADNACRVAAIFQVFGHGLGAVGLPAFEAAARIVEWHLNESRRFFGQVAMPKEDAEAAALDTWASEYCRARCVSSVPVSAIQKSGPSKLRPKVALESALATLAELGRARLAKGQGKARIVEINPGLLATAVPAVPAVIARPVRKAVLP